MIIAGLNLQYWCKGDRKKELLNRILHIYHDATNRRYSRNGDFIHISYMLDGEEINKVYDTKRGVFND